MARIAHGNRILWMGSVGTSLAGCQKEAANSAQQPPIVRTGVVASSNSIGDLVLSGELEADVSVAVSFRTLGTVQKVLVSEGQAVRQGQVLAVLDGGLQKDQLASAQAKVLQAEDAWNRLAPMHKNGTVPEIKWVEIETDRAQARSMVSTALRGVEDATLRAPLSGIVAKRSVEPGEQAPVGLPAFTIVQTGTMLATVPVAEKDVAGLRSGASARVRVEAIGQELPGKIREIGIEANPLTRTYKVKVAIPNPKGLLRVGMVSEVRLRVPGGRPAMLVPAAAVLTDAADHRFVWVEADGTVRRRLVHVSGFLKEGVAVDSGLSDGERVVVSGTPMLSDGLSVRIGN